MKFQLEKFVAIMDEGRPLFSEHWKEIARNRELINLDPDWDRYIQMDEAGLLQVATVRDEDALIGYSIDIITPHMHYKNDLFAMNDVLYVRPEYRGKGAGVRLIKYSMEKMKERGVSVVHMHMKLSNDFGPLMERLGYNEIERIYEKVLR